MELDTNPRLQGKEKNLKHIIVSPFTKMFFCLYHYLFTVVRFRFRSTQRELTLGPFSKTVPVLFADLHSNFHHVHRLANDSEDGRISSGNTGGDV